MPERSGRGAGRGNRASARVDRREAGMRLDLFLAGTFPGLSRKKAKRLVDGRKVAVDGRIEPMASRILRGGERIDVDLGEEPARAPVPALSVIYQDEQCVALQKPPDLPSGPTRDPARVHAEALAERELGVRLTLLHRLDKDTSGVLLLAKDREFAASLLDDFRHRRVEKQYLALVKGRPDPSFEVVSHLREGEGDRILTVRAGGMRAETRFRTLATEGGHALVEARPKTGRTHQIRVHLARTGCPILGDALYGGAASVGPVSVPRQMLHAWALTFDHPTLGHPLRVEAPVPADFLTVARAVFGRRLPPLLSRRSARRGEGS